MFACSTISLGTKKRIDLSLIEGSNVNSINNYLEQRNIIINKINWNGSSCTTGDFCFRLNDKRVKSDQSLAFEYWIGNEICVEMNEWKRYNRGNGVDSRRHRLQIRLTSYEHFHQTSLLHRLRKCQKVFSTITTVCLNETTFENHSTEFLITWLSLAAESGSKQKLTHHTSKWADAKLGNFFEWISHSNEFHLILLHWNVSRWFPFYAFRSKMCRCFLPNKSNHR